MLPRETVTASPAPLLDRIDIHVEVPAVKYQNLTSTAPGEPSTAMRLLPLCIQRAAALGICAAAQRIAVPPAMQLPLRDSEVRASALCVPRTHPARPRSPANPLQEHPKVRCNARMSSQQLKRFYPLDTTAEGPATVGEMAMTELDFNARAGDRGAGRESRRLVDGRAAFSNSRAR